MPDWQRLVRRRLSGLTLNAAERDEVQAELATHLEESCEVFRAEGLPEYEAVQRTLSQVADWKDLQRKIDSARIGKDTMTNRVTQLWLPGLLTFALSMGLLELVQKFGPRPIILNLDQGTPVLMFYTSWLLILPLQVHWEPIYRSAREVLFAWCSPPAYFPSCHSRLCS